MNLKTEVLQDLVGGQSTADAIADRLRVPEAAIHQILLRERSAGTVESRKICDDQFTIWLLKKPFDADRIIPHAFKQ